MEQIPNKEEPNLDLLSGLGEAMFSRAEVSDGMEIPEAAVVIRRRFILSRDPVTDDRLFVPKE
jgi:hypothetical protein